MPLPVPQALLPVNALRRCAVPAGRVAQNGTGGLFVPVLHPMQQGSKPDPQNGQPSQYPMLEMRHRPDILSQVISS
jgi:hypothetical protein